jgi:hypothetical protein
MSGYGAFDLCHVDLDLIDRHFDLPYPLANWATRGFYAFVMCICDGAAAGLECMYRCKMCAVSGLACSRCTAYRDKVEMILFASRRRLYYLDSCIYCH